MFIISPTKGGYRGDVVNSGFRQGRQDAYRDYVDNFNFAVKADAANNAENQLNVQRVANNYGLQNKMRQDARNEAINFVTDASKLDNAVVGNEINFAKNNALWPKAQAIGESQAGEVIATQAGNENKAINFNTEQSYLTENPNLIKDNTQAKYQQQGLQNQATQQNIANAKTNQQSTQLNNTALQFTVDDMKKAREEGEHWTNMSDDDLGKAVLVDYIAQQRANGDTRSDADIATELKANPNYGTILNDYRQSKIDNANQRFNQSLENMPTKYGRRNSSSSNKATEQSVTFKAIKQGEDFDPIAYLKSVDGTPILNDDGNPVAKIAGNIVHTPSGSYSFKHKPTEEEVREVLGLAPQNNGNNQQPSQSSNTNANADI